VTPGDLADVYAISGPNGGALWFEVANGDTPIAGYWEADVVDTVMWIRVMPGDAVPGSMAGGDGGGPCVV
jgi:hypothetical protein